MVERTGGAGSQGHLGLIREAEVSACEKCWSDAYSRARMSNRSQSDCYAELLEERKDNPCTAEQQRGDKRPVYGNPHWMVENPKW